MIYQILIIFSLAGIFVVLMRRLPVNGQSPNFNLPNFKFKISLGSFRSLRINPRFFLSRFRMPKFNILASSAKRSEKPVFHEEDPLSQADRAFVNRDFELAEKLYIKAVTRHPKDARVYARLGVIYMHGKNYKDARDALLTSLKFDSKVASRHYNLSLVYQALGNNQKALAEVKQAISLDATNEKYETLRQKLEQ